MCKYNYSKNSAMSLKIDFHPYKELITPFESILLYTYQVAIYPKLA